MPVTAALVGGGLNLVGGLVKGIVGKSQKNQGNKILSGLQYPTESVPGEEIQNQNLAQQQAGTGLPSDQYEQAMRNIQRQQLVSIQGSQSRRGGLGSIAGIQQGTNDATLNLDTADAKQKIANQNNLMKVNNSLASWKDKVWQNNVKGKYNQQYNYGMGLVGQGNQNLVGGVDQSIAGGGQAAYGSGLYGGGVFGGGMNNSTGLVGNIPGTYQNQQSPTGGSLYGVNNKI